MPWRAGPIAANGAAFVSATRFEYRRPWHLPAVSWHALRLRGGWDGVDGAVGVSMAADWLRATTYSLSVWRGEDDLRRWLGSPHHADLMRRFRPRLRELRAVGWTVERFMLGEAWREALRRLDAAPPRRAVAVVSGRSAPPPPA